MGQKVNPIGFRLGVNKTWSSNWYANKSDYAKDLNQDLKIREFLAKRLKDAAVASIIIERRNGRPEITINTAKPGVIIGRGGEDINKLRDELKKNCGEDAKVSIVDVSKEADTNAQLIADSIAMQIENRAPYRSTEKRAIRNARKAGVKGIKTLVSGRLNGAEMARSEFYVEGTVPLHTLRADIDYGTSTAATTYGKIGVKVWVYKGEILNKRNNDAKPETKRNNRKEVKDGDSNVNAKEN